MNSLSGGAVGQCFVSGSLVAANQESHLSLDVLLNYYHFTCAYVLCGTISNLIYIHNVYEDQISVVSIPTS